MSVESARAVYPIIVRLANDLAQAARERRTAVWISYDDFCLRCKEVGIKETPRTVARASRLPGHDLLLPSPGWRLSGEESVPSRRIIEHRRQAHGDSAVPMAIDQRDPCRSEER